jgi:TctA family transporter
MNREEWGRSWKSWLRGTLIGFPFGTLPAGGAEIPTFISYNVEKQLSQHKDQFGQGAIEGVAGPEAANNAAFSGVLVPLLTLVVLVLPYLPALTKRLSGERPEQGRLVFGEGASLPANDPS